MSNLRACFMPGDFSAAGCYRCWFPAKELEKRGAEILCPKFSRKTRADGFEIYEMDDLARQLAAMGANVFVFHNSLDATIPGVMRMLQLERDALVVADVDDDVLGIPSYNPAFEGTHPNVHPLRNRNHRLKSVSQADLVTVSTPFLAERLSRFNPNVHVLPNYLDWEMWEDVEPQYEVERKRLRIGWMGVSKWREGDLQVLRGLIGPWLERHPEVDFVAAGDEKVHDLLDIPKSQRVTYESVRFEDMELPSITATMDIGLVPLEMNPFNEAKSALKGMEYAACGIPCIASPTESYKTWVQEGLTGFLAQRPKDWTRALDELVSDDGLRRSMGRLARVNAEQHTIQGHVHEWEQLYRRHGREQDLADKAIELGAIQKHGELQDLLTLLEDRKLSRVCEIGTARGGTFHALCQLAEPDALVISLDLPGGAFGAEEGLLDLEKLRSYAQPTQDVRFLRADSHDPHTLTELKEILGEDARLDLLFIDADHSYEGVKKDWEMYGPLADLVGFHDILQHPWMPSCQVDRLWNQIKTRYPHKEFVRPGAWGGIGVLFTEREEMAA